MLQLKSMMVGSMQPKVMADFYEKVFQKAPDMADGGWYGWNLDGIFFTVGEHSEMSGPTKDPGRIMFNLDTEDVKGEFERIKGIDGVKVVKEPYEMGGMWISTLADPDGNYFQLATPWKGEQK